MQPQWHMRLDALLAGHAHLPFSKFVQAATVRQDGRPANRILSFRFFLKDSQLLFTTDTRTEKMQQLTANPYAELCWYFVESHVQMRLSGTLRLLEESDDQYTDQIRERSWSERTEASRQSFTWPTAGLPWNGPSAFTEPAPFSPPANFGLLAFTPERVEILDLSCQPHTRELHLREAESWQSIRINP